jgi:hypothetical protein
VKEATAPDMLHDWVYALVQDVCFDREYLYRCFVEHFSALMHEIHAEGRVMGGGEYRIPGIKSGLHAVIRWRLAHQVSYAGPNLVALSAELRRDTGEREGIPEKRAFELSSGAPVHS